MAKRPRGPVRQKSRCYVGRVGPLKVEFWYHPRVFPIRMGDWFIRDGDGWSLYQSAYREGDLPKVPIVVNVEGAAPVARRPAQCFKGFKELNSFLSDSVWPDGTAMGSVQLSLRTRAGRIIAQLKLADNGGLRLSVEGANVDDALAGLEAALSTEPAPWEVDPYPLDPAPKKRRK